MGEREKCVYTSSARHSFKKGTCDMSIGIGLLIGIVCELERDEMKLATKERRDEMKWRKQRPYFGHHGSHFTRKKRRVSCREIPRVFSSVTSHAMT